MQGGTTFFAFIFQLCYNVVMLSVLLGQKEGYTFYYSLRDGTSLVVFPEGRRTFTGKMGPFKKGAFQLADELQLPIVPLTIDGSFDVLPRTGKFIKWHRMTLTMHDPIYPQGIGPEDIKETMEKAYEAIQSNLSEKYK